jgi:hypothetical protein
MLLLPREIIFGCSGDSSHVRWVSVPTAWRVLGLRTEERPAAVEGSCEYIEQAAADKWQTKYMLLSRHQNVSWNQNIKIANRSFENVSQFKYLRATVTNQNLIHEEIKRRLNSGNACYHSVQNLLSSRLLSKNLKIRIYKKIILLVVLYECEIWSLILREEH